MSRPPSPRSAARSAARTAASVPPSAAAQARLAALGQQVREHSARGDWPAALRAAQQALVMVPGHPKVLGDLALSQMRLGRLDEARQAYQAALRAAPTDENLADGLAECSGRLGLHDEAAQAGRQALALKAAQVAGQPGWPLPAAAPPPLDADRPERNVIAFSLFGDDPRYGETAVLNVHAARLLLPAWRCRFYLDAGVPVAVQRRLAAAGAQLVRMDADAEVDSAAAAHARPARGAPALTWRFLVLDDPGVDRFLLRDADSLLSTREVAAVQAWLASGRWFHLMRDFCSHSELLLAGMWGGCGGVFRGVGDSLVAFGRQPPRLGARLVDQHWLRQHAWPTVRHSVLAHDGAFGFDGALPFPPHAPVGLGDHFHVGGNVCGHGIGGTAERPDGAPITWRLCDEQGRELCRHVTRVHGGRWHAALPKPYMDALAQGRWRCELVAA